MRRATDPPPTRRPRGPPSIPCRRASASARSRTADFPTPAGPATSSVTPRPAPASSRTARIRSPTSAPPDQPDAAAPSFAGVPTSGVSAGGVRALPAPCAAAPPRARGGAELALQGLLEPLELEQCATDVTAGGARPGHGQVGLLVGGLLGEHVVPSPEQAQELQVLLLGDSARLVDPGLVGVLGQQRPGVPLQRLGGERPSPVSQGPTGGSGRTRRRRPRRRRDRGTAPPGPGAGRRRPGRPGRGGRSAPPCAAAARRRPHDRPGHRASMTCSRCSRRPRRAPGAAPAAPPVDGPRPPQRRARRPGRPRSRREASPGRSSRHPRSCWFPARCAPRYQREHVVDRYEGAAMLTQGRGAASARVDRWSTSSLIAELTRRSSARTRSSVPVVRRDRLGDVEQAVESRSRVSW